MPNSVHSAQPLSQMELNLALRPFSFLTAAIGDYHSFSRHRIFALIGGLLWIFNLCMNYAFEFYEAKMTYGYTWVAVETIHLLSYLVYTFYTIQKTIPWLKEGLEEIQRNMMYKKTVEKVTNFTKRLPFLLLLFGIVCASIEYGILQLDKAMQHVNLGSSSINTTGNVFMNILRFISSFYVFLAYGIFWNVPVSVMLLAGYSMKCYSKKMGARLRSSDLPSFKESIQTYSERANFVKKSSSVCMVSLTVLLLTSVTRLGLNAYIFLFQRRKYLHIWHAMLPLAMMVYPLLAAAWITKQYRWFIIVVVRAWVERGEDSDDEEEDIIEMMKDGEKDDSVENICEIGRSTLNLAIRYADASDSTEAGVLKRGHINMADSNTSDAIKLPLSAPANSNGDLQRPSSAFTDEQSVRPNSAHLSVQTSNNGQLLRPALAFTNEKSTWPTSAHLSIPTNNNGEPQRPTAASTDQNCFNPRGKNPAKQNNITKFSTLVSAAKAVSKMKRATKRRFNFDKFLSYLESMRPIVGFSIGGVIVTSDLVSTILFLIFSIVAVLVQESIFGSQKSTLN